MDMSDDDAHRLCEIMNQATIKFTQNVNVEELIWAVSVAGAPDSFICAGALKESLDLDEWLDTAMRSRGGEVKPPMFWSHGTDDKVGRQVGRKEGS